MTNTTIEAEWLIQHKEAIPWSLLVGAEIVTDSDQRLVLERVTVRSWPAGPLLYVSYFEGGNRKSCTYNLQAFSGGFLRTIEVPKTLAVEIETKASEFEVELEQKALAERDRKLANEALARLAVEEKHAEFLRAKGFANLGVQPARKLSGTRITHCWSCKSHLDNRVDIECVKCQWIICACGACGCGWTPSRRY